MADFSTAAELELTVPRSELRSVRQEIEDAVGEVAVSVDTAGGGQRGSAGMMARGVPDTLDRIRVQDETRNELLADILDELDGAGVGGGSDLLPRGGGGGGGLGGLGGAIGSIGLGLGLTALLGAGALGSAIDINAPDIPPLEVPEVPPLEVPDIEPLEVPDIPPLEVPDIDPVPVDAPDSLPVDVPFPVPIPIGSPGSTESPTLGPSQSPTEDPNPFTGGNPNPFSDAGSTGNPNPFTDVTANPDPSGGGFLADVLPDGVGRREVIGGGAVATGLEAARRLSGGAGGTARPTGGPGLGFPIPINPDSARATGAIDRVRELIRQGSPVGSARASEPSGQARARGNRTQRVSVEVQSDVRIEDDRRPINEIVRDVETKLERKLPRDLGLDR